MLRLATHSPKIPRVLAASTQGRTNAFRAIRKASTVPGPRDPMIPGNPPLPPAAKQAVFDVKLPDTFYADPEPPVQVPYLPDFWDSANTSHLSQAEGHQPKIVVVAGAGTHPGGGPSHNLVDVREGEASGSTDKPVARSDSLLDDILEDLDLPPAQQLKANLRRLF